MRKSCREGKGEHSSSTGETSYLTYREKKKKHGGGRKEKKKGEFSGGGSGLEEDSPSTEMLYKVKRIA